MENERILCPIMTRQMQRTYLRVLWCWIRGIKYDQPCMHCVREYCAAWDKNGWYCKIIEGKKV